jgi:hypothetical protein
MNSSAAVLPLEGNMTQYITLTQGKVATIDDDDYDRIVAHKWCFNGRYAVRVAGRKTVYMHREVMRAGKDEQIDHIDTDRLNNQKSNLRQCDHTTNQHNRKVQAGTSIYKGVAWNKQRKKWRGQIVVAGKTVFLGYFKLEQEAAAAYDKAALHYFGEFARINGIAEE